MLAESQTVLDWIKDGGEQVPDLNAMSLQEVLELRKLLRLQLSVLDLTGEQSDRYLEIRKVTRLLKKIGDMYDYHPTENLVEPVILDLDWSVLNTPEIDVFDRFDELTPDDGAEPINGPGGKIFRVAHLYKVQPSDNATLNVVAAMELDDDGGLANKFPDVQMDLLVPDESVADASVFSTIVDFDIKRKEMEGADGWQVTHRIVDPKYRRQGLGSKVLEAFEMQLVKRAKDKRRDQVVGFEVGQLDVLLWLLDRGYEPLDEQDRERIGRILSGDQTLGLYSGPDEAVPDGQHWWIFENDAYSDDTWNDSKYMEESLRIKLVKKFAA